MVVRNRTVYFTHKTFDSFMGWCLGGHNIDTESMLTQEYV